MKFERFSKHLLLFHLIFICNLRETLPGILIDLCHLCGCYSDISQQNNQLWVFFQSKPSSRKGCSQQSACMQGFYLSLKRNVRFRSFCLFAKMRKIFAKMIAKFFAQINKVDFPPPTCTRKQTKWPTVFWWLEIFAKITTCVNVNFGENMCKGGFHAHGMAQKICYIPLG
jgi:hypothetical protein